ncbi:Ankyrin repeat-containing protein [Pragia fontium DSM 5563 = ATCC 49100]|uniref:Ankyrin repeat-containing protein n=1 Tax=Pragia fontium DSM 5563 = ATCC 49100 TaxID=1122977 RepID=A0AAJ4WBH3_9GAMM|nr:Ankyrin repeat-containing protein [Pragia fontium DSM 5563 = ATCC 49100]VEJ55336.1 Ankyrin repeats (3 copies) [Pragia fontium]
MSTIEKEFFLKHIIAICALLSLSFASHAKIVNNNNPEGFKAFKMDYAEMTDIANPNKLAWRVFYDKPSTGKDHLWFDAVKQGDLDTVKAMLAAGQDIEAKDTGSLDQTALGWAAFIGYDDMVDYLIAQKANLWATDKGDVYNTLKSAVLGKNTKVVEKIYTLLKDQVNINDQTLEDDGETLVMVAASNNRIETVKYLIGIGANVNISTTTQDKSLNSYDQSPLTYACKRDLKEMQQLLIAHGAVNHRTKLAACD